MRAFVYQPLQTRVVFGDGTLARLPEEVERLGLHRVLVLSTAAQAGEAERVRAMMADACAGTFTDAAMHTPVTVTDEAMALVRSAGVDGVVAIGGGSTTGLGKAIAWRTDLPQIVIPTTYAGSEMTPILGETENGVKTTRSSPRILPETVIYDVALSRGLPPGLSATSGLNAIAHAVEALYARDRNPIIDLMAEEGVRALAAALPDIAADPDDGEARAQALYGAWLCGCCLGAVGMALHHKLCHTLGGSFDLPHAETHAVVLPHALAYNGPAVAPAMAALRRALGTDDPARALFDLAGTLGAPQSLRGLGMPDDGIDRAVDLAMANPYWNPRPLDRAALQATLRRAWQGAPPAAA
ncbi:MAG: maleylacetate reductase [Sphingomonas adhaesiva]|uniref:maleylacetate reductase n=1 Tax=Sphingomonas adhaesiva TaxID=28212 RepID=UPI0030728389